MFRPISSTCSGPFFDPLRARGVETYVLGEVGCKVFRRQACAAETDIAVRTDQVERGLRNLRSREFIILVSISGDGVDAGVKFDRELDRTTEQLVAEKTALKSESISSG